MKLRPIAHIQRIHFLIVIITLSFSILAANQVHAQPQIPGGAEPARAAESVGPIQTETPSTTSSTPMETEITSVLTPEAGKIKFTLKKIIVQDPVIFCEEDLVCPFQHLIGQSISLKELQAIATTMTTRYQKAGYILTQVILPEQKIKDGVVALQVIPGHVDKVEIQGCVIPCMETILMEYGCSIQQSYPLNMKDLERYTLLANDIPGVQLKAVLKPSKTKRGASDLIFMTCQDLETATLSINNFSSPFLGPQQIVLTGTRNSWFVGGDETQALIVTAGDKKFNFGQIRHGEFLNCEGLRFNVAARYARANPGSLVAPLNIAGINQVVSLELSYPWIRSRAENLFLQAGFLISDDRVKLLSRQLYNDRLRPIYGSIIYSRLDNLKGVNQFQFTITQGLKILNASGKKNISRPGGESEFTKLGATLSRTQAFPCHYSFFASITGQYTFNPLLVSTQFGVGGPGIGRGYDPSEILGDHGIAGTLELRKEVSYFSYLEDYVQKIQYYGFVDAGYIRNINKTPPPQNQSITSAGIGVRVKLLQCVDANLYVAKPLTKRVTSLNSKPWRTYAAITFSF